MISIGETIVVRMRAAHLEELRECEFGSYEDHIRDDRREEPYRDGRLHIVELIDRSPCKTRVYLNTETEINEFFVQACTGTFGLYHLGALRRIYKQLAPFVSAKTKRRISYRGLGY